MKNKKGITLIALVITIIVLLILAGVAIVQLTNNGLFNNSLLAKGKYENAQSEERDMLKQYENAAATGKIVSNRDDNVTTGGNPTGTIITFYGKNAPAGYLKCDGTLYNISDYPSLAALIKDTNGSYGTEQNGKFAVPDLSGEFLRGSTSETAVGTHTDEGLPNILGAFSTLANGGIRSNINVDFTSGAFYKINRSGYKDGYTDGNNTNATNYAGFEARRSNPIYGNSEHVTPSNTSVLYCIKF